MSEVGTRKNEGKLRWRNFPPYLFRPVIEVGQQGEKKYGTYNFLKGQTVNNCLDSLMRHLDSFIDPDQSDNDAESGITHLGHIAWNALVAAYMIKTRPDLDDRYKPAQKVKPEALRQAAEDAHKMIEKMFPKPKFAKGDVVKHINNDVEVTVEGTYYDEKGQPVLFVRDADQKIFAVDPNFYRSIYV